MKIPFTDLKAQYAKIREEVLSGVAAVFEHGQFIMGPEVKELEAKLAAFTGARYAVSCSSGTDALLMPLLVQGIGKGDAIFTTPFTFIATAEVISLLGATPVFVDVDARTFNMDPAALEAAVHKVNSEGRLKPRAVIPVDLFGLPADYDAIKTVSARAGMFVIEDAAQSLGGSYKGRKVGCLADVAATSFFPSKPLGCYGDGGAIFTDNEDLAKALRSVRVHGQGTDKYDNVRIGLNARLDTVQAAVLLAKLRLFGDEIGMRNAVAARYSESLKGLPVVTPYVPEHSVSAWAQYTILTEKRDALQEHLKSADIPTMVYYPKPLHLQTAYRSLELGEGSFPVSERLAKNVLSLPFHPYLAHEDQDFIVSEVQEFFA